MSGGMHLSRVMATATFVGDNGESLTLRFLGDARRSGPVCLVDRHDGYGFLEVGGDGLTPTVERIVEALTIAASNPQYGTLDEPANRRPS